METLFDLPAHPLMVHFPAVAIPILAISAVAIAFVPAARSRYGSLVAVLAVVTVIATLLAASSGEELAEGLNYPESQIGTHRDLGETLRWFVLGLGAVVVGWVGHIGAPRGEDLPSGVRHAAKALVVVFAVLSLVWAIRTGHEGAKSVWEEQGALLVQTGPDDDDADDDSSAPTTATSPAPTTLASATTAPTTAPATSSATTTSPLTTGSATTTATTATTTSAGSSSTSEPASGAVTTADPTGVDAEAIYIASCARCHAEDGTGNPPRPALIGINDEVDDVAIVVDRVTNGGRFMPDFRDDLSPEEIQAVSEYVLATF